ncbi:MAG: transporter substrate-binding domain-containing protein [Bacteroidales bacterium]|nr:transporter substrate-binding domain-containing protein [Bacteroidales bacterium]
MKLNHKLLSVALIVLMLGTFSSCSFPEQEKKYPTVEEASKSELSEIREKGKLVALTDYNSTSYFIYRGEPMGYQYELLRRFADHLGVDLELKVSNNLDTAFHSLERKKVDLLAMDLTVTKSRKKRFDFSDPLNTSRQVLVQRLPSNWRKMNTWDEVENNMIRNPLDLAGDTVYVQQNSSFYDRLVHLQEEIGDTIYTKVMPDKEVEELIIMVAKGKIDYTVADEHIAKVNKKYYPNLDVETAISFPQKISWAMPKGSDSLQMELNNWLNGFQKKKVASAIYDKYYENPRGVNVAYRKYHSVKSGRVSKYDEIIKREAKKIGWDWRLLASLIYQESSFRPNAVSWAGAWGLMQFMPNTAHKFGVSKKSTPKQQIKAGVEFIKYLDNKFKDTIKDPKERKKFVMAAYNVGIAHVYDAQRLAEKFGKDPTVWNNNVDQYLLKKAHPDYYQDAVVKYGYCRGEEPYNYVYQILERYDHYRNILAAE